MAMVAWLLVNLFAYSFDNYEPNCVLHVGAVVSHTTLCLGSCLTRLLIPTEVTGVWTDVEELSDEETCKRVIAMG